MSKGPIQIPVPDIHASCGQCKGERNHQVLYRFEESDSNDDVSWHNSHEVIRCRGCDHISFRILHENSEDIEVDPITGDLCLAQSITIFPDPEPGREPIDNSYRLPRSLAKIYFETLKALNSSQPVLTGIGIRAIIETVCKEQNARGGNLKGKIDDLVVQKVLPQTGADILHKLRVLGNDAAHEVKPHNKHQLSIAMDVVNHLLLGVYVLPREVEDAF